MGNFWSIMAIVVILMVLVCQKIYYHFGSIMASTSLVAPRGYIALIYIFRWDFRQLVPSNLFRVGFLNLGGNLALGNRERES